MASQGEHKKRIFDNQPLPKTIGIDLAGNLSKMGGAVNSLPKDCVSPNTEIKTINKETLPAVWYPHSGVSVIDRKILTYDGVDKFGSPKTNEVRPSGWILTEGAWLPLVVRVLRVLTEDEIKKAPNIFKRVEYFQNDKQVEFRKNKKDTLTSLGAADNEFFVDYSATMGKWLVLDQKNVGYKACGVGIRVYGAGCYFGGFWTCANISSAKGVDKTVCKTKNPPWPTKYFLAVIDDLVYNAGVGESIKSGRIKLLKEII